jgi:hypothetical protein
VIGLRGRNQRRAGISSSQRARTEMLLLELVGSLFQFEQRDPEFAPLFQFPPKSATRKTPITLYSSHF